MPQVVLPRAATKRHTVMPHRLQRQHRTTRECRGPGLGVRQPVTPLAGIDCSTRTGESDMNVNQAVVEFTSAVTPVTAARGNAGTRLVPI